MGLLKNEPMSRAIIAEKLGVGVTTALTILDILEARGIVGSRHADGKSIIYYLRRD